MACAGLGLLMFLPTTAAAQELKLQVEANRSQIYLGESFILQVIVSGSSQPALPNLSAIKNCTIKLLDSRDISNYSITIINGRLVKEGFSGRVVSYEITPTLAGQLTIGPVSVAVDGQQLSEPGPSVLVTDIEQQDRVIISVTSSQATVLVDEPFEITLKILIRRLAGAYADSDPIFIDQPPDLTVPYLAGEGLAGLASPDLRRILEDLLVAARNQPGLAINHLSLAPDLFDFDSFFREMAGQGRKAKFMLPRREAQQDHQLYFEYSLTVPFVPQDENNYVFGPVVFKGTVPTEISSQGQAKGMPIFAVGPACTVRVVPPPEEGRPLSFTGGLGTNLAATAALDVVEGKVGDPLKLTLALSGQIRFDKMLPPKLNLQTNITRHFTVYDDTVQTVKQDNQRKYIYILRPDHPGSFELPPIEIAYYDTQCRKYKTISTQPVPITIMRGAEVSAAQLIGNTNVWREAQPDSDAATMLPAPIRPVAGGANSQPLGSRGLLAAAAAGPLVYLLVVLAGLIRQHYGQWRQTHRRRLALRHTLRHLQLAKRQAQREPGKVGQVIRTAICYYLTSRLAACASSLTPDDVRRLLSEADISQPTRDDLVAIFERCFNADFSKQNSISHALAADVHQVRRLLQTIDGEIRS